MKLAVLLSTYNGGKYIREQINSILNQSYTEWDLYIRDDFSNDDTIAIVKEYVSENLNIHLIKSESNVGAAKSFLLLLEQVKSDYFMFCDQDDVWLEDKISKSLDKIKNLENGVSNTVPVLVFSDSKVVDSQLNLIHDSFWDYNKSLPYLIIETPDFINVFNCAPGCTMIINNALKLKMKSYDDRIIMHDWYAMLIAFKTGKVDYIDERLMLYRQHSNNVIGADKVSMSKNVGKLSQLRKTINEQVSVYKFVSKYTQISWFKYYKLKLRFNILRFK